MAATGIVRSSLLTAMHSTVRQGAGKNVSTLVAPAATVRGLSMTLTTKTSPLLLPRSFFASESKSTWHDVHIKSVSEGLLTTTKTEGGHTVYVDEPVAFGGTDKGANPLETVLAALPSCETFLARMVAKEMKFKSLGNIEYEIKGGLDLAGAFGKPDVSKTFQKLNIAAKVHTDESEERVKELGEKVLSRCPVAQLYVQAGVQITHSWTRASK